MLAIISITIIKSELKNYKDDESFRYAFREWYQNIRNQDSFPEIWEYLMLLKKR